LFFGKKKKSTEPAQAETGRELFQSHHFAAKLSNGVVLGEVRCEQITERESTLVLDEIIHATTEAGSAKLVIDMKHVGVLASAGIGTLVQAHERLKAGGGGLAIYNLSEDIEQLMKLTRMDKLFGIESSKDAAIASLS